jgi:GntR family transcriptional regulator
MADSNPWQNEVQIQRSSKYPLYLQVKEGLERWIINGLGDGMLAAGDQVPSEMDLCRSLNVSQITARRALEELRRQGLIQRYQGRGSFITGQTRLTFDMHLLFSLTAYSREQGLKPTFCLLESEEIVASPNVANKLQIAPGSPIASLVRLRLLNNRPAVIDSSYIPLATFPGLLDVYHEGDSLYDVMASHYQHAPLRTVDVLEPALINSHEAEILEVQVGAAAILLERTALGAGGDPIEFGKSVFRGDMFRFSVETLQPYTPPGA